MKRTFTAELLEDKETKTIADLEFNECKLQAVILEVEQALLAIRLRKTALIRAEQQRIERQESEPSADKKSTSWLQKIFSIFRRG